MKDHRDRNRRRFVPLVAAVVALALVGVGTGPATAAKPKKPQVTLGAPSQAEVGKAFQVDAVVKRGAKGQQITLQQQVGTTWTQVAALKLPAKGGTQKTVAFSVTPSAAGAQVYRAVLAKKKTGQKTTKGATSSTVQVTVTSVVPPVSPPVSPPVEPPVVPPDPGGSQVTFTSSTSTSNEQTNITFSGTVTGAPSGTPVQIQYARGKSPGAAAWVTAKTVSTTGDGSALPYSGSFVLPVLRSSADNGAPQLNLRAVAAGATSATRSILVRTRFDGTYAMYDENDEIVGNDTFQVIYSDKTWRMRFGTAEARGVTEGWELVDSAGLRFAATYHDPTPGCTPGQTNPPCLGDGYPYIDYVATFTTSGGDLRRIEGTAYLN